MSPTTRMAILLAAIGFTVGLAFAFVALSGR
jgi:hypothetical protein